MPIEKQIQILNIIVGDNGNCNRINVSCADCPFNYKRNPDITCTQLAPNAKALFKIAQEKLFELLLEQELKR